MMQLYIIETVCLRLRACVCVWGGAQVGVGILKIFTLECAVSPSGTSPFESVVCVCDASPVGAWQVLPEETGSEGIYGGGGGGGGGRWQPLLCTRMCRGMLWGGTM